MSIQTLPASANIEHLKKQAKRLLKSARAKTPETLDRIGPYFGDPLEISLQQAQLVIAREYGFSSWVRMKRHIEGGTPELLTTDQLSNRFLDLVTLAYGTVPDLGPERFRQAAELLDAHPEIRDENIHVAAACGDVERVSAWLDREPDLLNKKGGIFDWEPLMYAAYGRLPDVSSYPAARLLLEQGANSNAYYMWGGQYRFTALTGVFGQGEGGPVNLPEHPQMLEFARALLEHGANPNDSQAAYNRCFEPDNTCLELLLEFGLADDQMNNWMLVEDDRLVPHPSETIQFQLFQAIHHGYAERVKLLIDHGVALNKRDKSYDNRSKDKTPYQAALLLGQKEIAQMLRDAGAEILDLSTEDQFEVACFEGDAKTVRQMLGKNSGLLARTHARHTDMLCDAVKQRRHDALETMLAVGFDPNTPDRRSPLHEAAFTGDVVLAQLLIDAGADTVRRDPHYNAAPIGFALHAEQEAMIALLDDAEMDIFAAAARGKIDQVKKQLAEDPSRLNQLFATVRHPNSKPSEMDWMTPIFYAVLNDRVEVVQYLIEAGADLSITGPGGEILDSIARERSNDAVLRLLKG